MCIAAAAQLDVRPGVRSRHLGPAPCSRRRSVKSHNVGNLLLSLLPCARGAFRDQGVAVARPLGDRLDGASIVGLDIGRQSLHGRSVVFFVSFADGRQGIFRASKIR